MRRPAPHRMHAPCCMASAAHMEGVSGGQPAACAWWRRRGKVVIVDGATRSRQPGVRTRRICPPRGKDSHGGGSHPTRRRRVVY